MVGLDLDCEAREADQEASAVVVHADHLVGEGARLRVGELELPRMYGDLHRALGWRGARQFAAAAEPHTRSRRRRCGGPVQHVGTRERGHHHAGWASQQLWRRGELHEPAVVDHPDPLGQGGSVVERMSDQQCGEFQLLEDVGELVTHLLARDRVQRAEWLVEQQHAGLARQSAGQRYALALAT